MDSAIVNQASSYDKKQQRLLKSTAVCFMILQSEFQTMIY